MTEHLFGIEGLTEKGWIAPDRDLDLDTEIRPLYEQVKKAQNSLSWALCDLINWMEDLGDDAAYDLVDAADWENPTIRRGCRVARQVPMDSRKWSIWKHEEISYAPPEIRKEFEEAEEEPTVQEIRGRADEHEGKDNAETLPLTHCSECGAPAYAWRHEPSTVTAAEEASRA